MSVRSGKKICRRKKKSNDHSHTQWAFCAEAALMPDPQTNDIVNGKDGRGGMTDKTKKSVLGNLCERG